MGRTHISDQTSKKGIKYMYGTENKIWAGFEPVGNTQKIKIGADYEQLLRAVFSCFQGQKNVGLLKKIF